jgi:signal transduction histidine kinase
VVLEKVLVDGKTKALYRARSMVRTDDGDSRTDLSKPFPRIVLPPGHDRMVVSFAALSLASPENLGFRYRMKPLVRDWEEPDNRRSATFTRLPAGNYDFQVIACNSAGVWNEVGATLEIVVQPFFWETWWFRIGGGIATALTAGGLVFLALRRKHQRQLSRIAAKRALEQERSRIARDIHDDLGANLTRISLLSQHSHADGAATENQTLDQIQKTARQLMRSMDEVVWAINPEHDTFDDLANYISSYAQDFLSVAGIRCRLEMPIAVPDRPLTAQLRHNLFLAFKESLNNIAKYAEASEVRISLHPAEDGFTLKVEDNGRGIDPDASPDPSRPNSGSGLANMTSRMDEIGASCSVKSTLGKGTCVEFRIPFTTRI